MNIQEVVEVLRVRKLHISRSGFTFSPTKEYVPVKSGIQVFDYAFRIGTKIRSGRVTDISRQDAIKQVVSIIKCDCGDVQISLPRN